MTTDAGLRVYYVTEVCVHLWRECIPVASQNTVRMADVPKHTLDVAFKVCKRCRVRCSIEGWPERSREGRGQVAGSATQRHRRTISGHSLARPLSVGVTHDI